MALCTNVGILFKNIFTDKYTIFWPYVLFALLKGRRHAAEKATGSEIVQK